MVIKGIIDSRFKKNMLDVVGGLLVFYAISAICLLYTSDAADE